MSQAHWPSRRLPTEDEPSDPRRLEVLAYSDSPAYVRPVPGLSSLQSGLRSRELASGTTHLTPPLSLSVRSVADLKADARPAHLAIVQDIGSPLTAAGEDPGRRPAFQDLLVPIVTTASSQGRRPRLGQRSRDRCRCRWVR